MRRHVAVKGSYHLPRVTSGIHGRRDRGYPSNLYSYVGKILLIVFRFHEFNFDLPIFVVKTHSLDKLWVVENGMLLYNLL